MPSRRVRRLFETLDAERLNPDVGRAARATAALLIALGVAVSGRATWLEASFLAVSAHTLANTDVRGPYPQRVAFLALLGVGMVAFAAIGAASAGAWPLMLAASVLLAANIGLWRHLTAEYGPAVATPTGLLCYMAMLTPSTLAAGPRVVHHALAVAAGAAIAVVVHAALWPIRAQHPLRHAVADAWLAAACLFDALRVGRPATIVAADALADAESQLRGALDVAQSTLARASGDARRSRRVTAARLEALRTAAGRLGSRGDALATALDFAAGRAPSVARATAQAAFEALASAARAAALATLSQQPAHLAAADVRLRRAAGLLDGLVAASDDDDAAIADVSRALVDSVREAARALEHVTDRAGQRAVVPMQIGDPGASRRPALAAKPVLSSTLNLHGPVQPMVIRFSARLALLLSLGVTIVSRAPATSHPYWLPLTILVLAQPDYGATRRRAAERFGGTFVGAILGSLVLRLALPLPLLLVAIGAMAFAFSYEMRRRYAIAVGFLTVMIVLLTETSHPPSLELTIERLAMTAVGGAMTLAATLFFWPHWERDRYAGVLAAALRANRDFLISVAGRLRAGGAYTPDEVAARRRAEVANAGALASLGRLFADPANRRGDVERAAAMLEGNRRLTRLFNLLLLQSLRGTAPPADAATALGAFADRAGGRLDAYAIALSSDGDVAPPSLPMTIAAASSSSRGIAVIAARIEAELNAMRAALRTPKRRTSASTPG